MEFLIVIGNLGSDAEVRTDNGNEYTRFNVAETRKWTGSDGVEHEETIWNQCIMHGKQEKLLPYLLKGAKVCVMGRASTRVYSSAKERRMVAGISIQVDRLELIGSIPDPVPRSVVAPSGELVPVSKCFYIDFNVARQYAGQAAPATFFDRNGSPCFLVDYNGFVTRSLPADGHLPNGTQIQQSDNTAQSAGAAQVEDIYNADNSAPFVGADNPAVVNVDSKSDKNAKGK